MKPTNTSSNQHQLEWWAKDAVVYFIAAGMKPRVAVKIGVTTWATVTKRLGALQSSNHEPLELLGVIAFQGGPQPMKEAEDKERELHGQFSHLQRAKEGKRGYEWFTAHQDLLAFIDKIAAKPEKYNFPRQARTD